MTTKELEKTALQLKAIDRIHLVEKLINSLDKPDPEIEKAWIKESEARITAYERGELVSIPAEKVLRNINFNPSLIA